MFHHQPQRFRKTENGVGRFAPRIREIRDGEERSVNVVVPGDQQQFHCSLTLDSECMMLDDQGVTEEWIVRVQGREYGPVNIETLREWKAEGRLLPANEARRADVDLWTTAAEIPGLFSLPPAGPFGGGFTPPPVQAAPPRVAVIFTQTPSIYPKRFSEFPRLFLFGFSAVRRELFDKRIRQTAAGFQPRYALGSRHGLRISDVHTFDCDVAGLHRGNPNS